MNMRVLQNKIILLSVDPTPAKDNCAPKCHSLSLA